MAITIIMADGTKFNDCQGTSGEAPKVDDRRAVDPCEANQRSMPAGEGTPPTIGAPVDHRGLKAGRTGETAQNSAPPSASRESVTTTNERKDETMNEAKPPELSAAGMAQYQAGAADHWPRRTHPHHRDRCRRTRSGNPRLEAAILASKRANELRGELDELLGRKRRARKAK